MSISRVPDEFPLHFQKSSFCAGGGCVEVAVTPSESIALRDAKDPGPNAPVLEFTRVEWDAFLSGVHAGEFSYDALRGTI